jgi:hypothetical protein
MPYGIPYGVPYGTIYGTMHGTIYDTIYGIYWIYPIHWEPAPTMEEPPGI